MSPTKKYPDTPKPPKPALLPYFFKCNSCNWAGYTKMQWVSTLLGFGYIVAAGLFVVLSRGRPSGSLALPEWVAAFKWPIRIGAAILLGAVFGIPLLFNRCPECGGKDLGRRSAKA